MKSKSETETQAGDARIEAKGEANRICDEVNARAGQAYKEAKSQADMIYKEAKKGAVDKQVKKEATAARKKAINLAKQAREATKSEAVVVFGDAFEQSEEDYTETVTKSQEGIEHADEAYEKAKKKAAMAYKEAKKQAVDKQAKKEAAAERDKAIDLAEQVRHKATRKSR